MTTHRISKPASRLPKMRHATKGMSHDADYLKNPAYFLPSLLGPVWFDLINLMLPSLMSTGLTYFFT